MAYSLEHNNVRVHHRLHPGEEVTITTVMHLRSHKAVRERFGLDNSAWLGTISLGLGKVWPEQRIHILDTSGGAYEDYSPLTVVTDDYCSGASGFAQAVKEEQIIVTNQGEDNLLGLPADIGETHVYIWPVVRAYGSLGALTILNDSQEQHVLLQYVLRRIPFILPGDTENIATGR